MILSEGLNNCLKRLLPTTTDKQLGFLVAASKRTFPNAKIHVPVINYLDKLDKDQLQLWELVNKTILKTYDFLTQINRLS